MLREGEFYIQHKNDVVAGKLLGNGWELPEDSWGLPGNGWKKIFLSGSPDIRGAENGIDYPMEHAGQESIYTIS